MKSFFATLPTRQRDTSDPPVGCCKRHRVFTALHRRVCYRTHHRTTHHSLHTSPSFSGTSPLTAFFARLTAHGVCVCVETHTHTHTRSQAFAIVFCSHILPHTVISTNPHTNQLHVRRAQRTPSHVHDSYDHTNDASCGRFGSLPPQPVPSSARTLATTTQTRLQCLSCGGHTHTPPRGRTRATHTTGQALQACRPHCAIL
jgi:hypothetical protein